MMAAQPRRSSIVSKRGTARMALAGSSPGRKIPASRMRSIGSSRSDTDAVLETT